MSLWPDPAFHRGLMLGGEDGRSLLVGSLPQLSMLPFIWIFSCGFSSFFTGGRGVTKQKWHTSSFLRPVRSRWLFPNLLGSIEAALTPSSTITAALKVHMMKANEMLCGGI